MLYNMAPLTHLNYTYIYRLRGGNPNMAGTGKMFNNGFIIYHKYTLFLECEMRHKDCSIGVTQMMYFVEVRNHFRVLDLL